MLHFRAQLFDQAHRYRRLSSIFGGNWGGQRGEHHAILKACLKRDADSACKLTEQHIRLGLKGIRAHIPGWATTIS
jgi:DNA-binding GntR family transcriptional regulator